MMMIQIHVITCGHALLREVEVEIEDKELINMKEDG